MCGIVGYIGHREAYPIIIKGLKRLEYRGYDSAGLTLYDGQDLKLSKTKGKVSDLENISKEITINGTIGMGHTRWATHGVPNDVNSHPHLSNSGNLAIIHNGIIENEFCPIFIATTTDTPRINYEEVDDYKWMKLSEFIKGASDDKVDKYSWWCKDQIKYLVANQVFIKYLK